MKYELVMCPNCGHIIYMKKTLYEYKSKNNIPYLCSLQCKAEWIGKTKYTGVIPVR